MPLFLDGLKDKLFGGPGREQKVEAVAVRPVNMPSGVMVLTDATFMRAANKYPLVVIDVWAPWCAPCKIVSPVVAKLAKDYAGRVAFGKLNTAQNQAIPSRFGIKSIPTIMVFSQGRYVDKVVGAVPRGVIESKIKRHLGQ